jgi:hypothetical protein
VQDWAVEVGARVYRITFEDMKKTSLHEKVKYYPSVALISDGEVIGYLRADEDADADEYNDYEAFRLWMRRYF